MRIRKTPLTGLLLSWLFGCSMPAFAHDMPVELWVLYLMPSCEKHIDGFASKSEAPYAQWRQKHSEEASALEGMGMREPDTTEFTDSDWLRKECDNLLNYVSDDIQPPDPRFASPEDTWNLFLQASLSGDKATVAECFSAVVRAKYMSFIDQLTPEQLAKTAEPFTGFQLMEGSAEGVQEAWINKGDRAGIAYFAKTSRGWLISQLP